MKPCRLKRLSSFAYAFDDEDVKIVDLACGEELPQEVLDAIDDPNVIKWAWNAQFERTCIGHYLGRVLSPDSWVHHGSETNH